MRAPAELEHERADAPFLIRTLREASDELSDAVFHGRNPVLNIALPAYLGLAAAILERLTATPALTDDNDSTAGEAVTWIRSSTKHVTGTNCTFVDDDLRLLTHLARRAVDADLTDQLPSSVREAIKAHSQLPDGET